MFAERAREGTEALAKFSPSVNTMVCLTSHRKPPESEARVPLLSSLSGVFGFGTPTTPSVMVAGVTFRSHSPQLRSWLPCYCMYCRAENGPRVQLSSSE